MPIYLTSTAKRNVCALKIKWAHEWRTMYVGRPFPSGMSLGGQHMSADRMALVWLHRMRTIYGTVTQRRESKEWLKNEDVLCVPIDTDKHCHVSKATD